jgi:hypothetical protein
MDQRNNLFTCLCSPQHYANFPDISVQLGNNEYRMPKESYIELTNDKCYFLIMKMNFPYSDGFWILGDNFLQNYVTVFDLDKMRVGLVG